MGHSFIAYIDESGDEGLGGRPRGGGIRGGSSHWLTIGACVFRAARNHESVSWRNEILQAADKKSKILHFVDLTHEQRIVAADTLSKKSIRGLSVLSNKQSIPVGTFGHSNQYYFYLARYLIERISWLCKSHRIRGQGDGTVKIIFSRRGSISYDEFRSYLIHLRDNIETSIAWDVIDIDGIDAKDHSTLAGLQLADVVASAIACGIDPNRFGNCECRYAQLLRSIMYNRNRNFLSYGVKVVPQHDGLLLTEEQKQFIAIFS